jgi:sugar lactone lactonase YvrE
MNGCAFTSVVGVATDSRGLVYAVEASATTPIVRVVNPTASSITVGSVTYAAGYEYPFAGTGALGTGSTSTPTAPTSIAFGATPNGIAVDANNNVYITDTGNNKISIVSGCSTTCMMTTFAGNGTVGSVDSTTATSAEFNQPRSISVDSTGTNLYVAEYNGGKIRKINLTTSPYAVTTVVGGGSKPDTCTGYTDVYGDGCLATAAYLSGVRGVHLDAAGNMYIADGNDTLNRMVNASTGIITTIVGGGANPTTCTGNIGANAYGNGCLATQAVLSANPMDVIPDSSGNYYLLDYTVNLLRVVVTNSSAIAFSSTAVGQSSAVSSVVLTNTGAGSLTLSGYSVTSGASNFTLKTGTGYCTSSTVLTSGTSCLVGVVFNPTSGAALTGTVTITDNAGGISGTTQTVALSGTGTQPAVTVALAISPASASAGQSVTFTATLTATGSSNTPSGTVDFMNGSKVLGSATISSGKAIANLVLYPGTYSVTAYYEGDTNFGYAISSATALTVAPLAADSIIFTATPTTGAPGSTTSLSTTVAQSSGTTLPTGTVTFLDGTNALSTQTLVPGQASSYTATLTVGTHTLTASYGGDANYAPVVSTAVTVTIGSTQIISITPGILSTYAGTGIAGNTGNGSPANLAKVNQPVRSVFDSAGNLYFADTGNNLIRKITPAGTISIFAGSTAGTHSGDNGLATAAGIITPRDLAFDSLGNMYILEAGYNDIRRVDTNGYITTYAGIPETTNVASSGDGGQATAANLNQPRAITVDSSGNLYIAEFAGQVIRKVTTAGIISTIAGTAGTAGSSGNGAASTSALLSGPYSLNFDMAGNLYIAEYGNSDIRKINTSNIISLVAGTAGTSGYSGDGLAATSATLSGPRAVAVDGGGNVYIGDTGNDVVRKVNSSGIISTIAGSHTLGAGYTGDGGAATAGELNQIYGITLDANSNIYIGDQGANVIRKVTVGTSLLAFPNQIPGTTSAASSVTLSNSGGLPLTLSGLTLANTTGAAFALAASGGTDCTATTVLAAGQSCLIGVKFSPTALSAYAGTITVTDNTGGISGTQQTIQVSGTGALLPVATLTVTPASVPVGVSTSISISVTNSAYPAAGTPTGTVALMSGTTTITTLTLTSGAASYTATLPRGNYSLTAVYSGDANFNSVTSSAVAFSVYGTNTTTTFSAASTRVAQGTGDLLTATVAPSSGTGTPTGTVTFSQTSGMLGTANLVNGVATLTQYFPLTGSQTITATYNGDTLYNPSTSSSLTITVTSGVVAVLTPGVITTYAGNGSVGSTGDGGLATAATLNAPGGAGAVDAVGNVYIPDTNGSRVRKVTPAGIISTIAGNGTATHTGDGGLATAATVDAPRGVAIDASGNIFIVEAGYNVIRKIDTTGIITTYAGIPSLTAVTDSGDGGAATSANINTPRGIAVDVQGNLYIAESTGEVIRKVSTSGIISTVAGVGVAGNTGNGGAANVARLNAPDGVAVDAQGNYYIADASNSVVRKVTASTGIISLYAGNATGGYAGDGGLAYSANLLGPRSVAVDEGGNVYIADTNNFVVRKVDTDGYISTIAGTGISGNNGDGGSATLAQMGSTYGVTVDSAGNLFIVDNTNNNVRKLTATSGLVQFGSVPFGTTTTATVTLGNAGSQPLVLSGIAITGTGFTETTPASRGCTVTTTLAPGSECLLTVSFKPTTLGQYTGTVTFTDNAGSPQLVTLTGTGIKLPPTFTLTSTPVGYTLIGSPASLTVKVSSTSLPSTIATGTVQFLNGSTAMSTVTLDSTGSATLALGSALPAGSYGFSTYYSGDANFQSGYSPSITFWVQNDFAIALSSTSGQMSPGGSLTTTLTITPNGLLPTTIQMSCINQPVYISCTFSPSSFAATASPMTSTVTITAKAPPVGAANIRGIAAISLLLLTMMIARRKHWVALQCILAVLVLAGLGTMSGCNAANLPTPTVVPVTVKVTAGGAPHTLTYNVNFY